jgi:hypothetical protein
MKRAILIIMIVLLIGLGALWYFGRPTGVVVTATLGEGGPDVTDRIEWQVDRPMGGGSDGGISINFVETIFADTDDPRFYRTAPGETVRVRGLIGGNVELEANVTTPRGRLVAQTFTPEAGFLDLTVRHNETANPRLEVNGPGGFITLPDPGQTTMLLRPGDYRLALITDAGADTAEITIDAGEFAEAALDARVSMLSLTAGGDIAWPEALPPLMFEVQTGDDSFDWNRPLEAFDAGRTPPQPIVYGSYPVTVTPKSARGFGANISTEAEITVSEPEQLVEIPLAFQVVRVALPDLPEGADLSLRTTVLETAGKGEALATGRVEDGRAVLAFAAPEWDPDTPVAVALWVRDSVVGMADLGPNAPGTETEVALRPGDGLNFCEKIYDDRCAPLDEVLAEDAAR